MIRATLLALGLGMIGPAVVAQAEQRALTLDDTFRLEGIGTYYGGPIAYAPGGKAVAFSRQRADELSRNFKIEYLWNNDRGDVWVKTEAGEPVNITRGSEDGSGWWAPVWSPDGRYISLLSTRGPGAVAENVWLWLWDSRTGELRRLSDRGVDIDPGIYRRPHLWMDERHVLCPLLPEGEQPVGLDAERKTQRIASAEWPKTVHGKETTVSVLDSGVAIDIAKRPQGRMVRFDVVAGTSNIVAENSSVGLMPSPRGDYIAFGRQIGISVPQAGKPVLQQRAESFTLDVVDLSGRRVLTAQKVAGDVIVDSMRWSPRGDRVAFIGYETAREGAQLLFVGNPARGSVDAIDLGTLDTSTLGTWWIPPQIEWTANGELLLRGIERVNDKRPPPEARRDWWLVSLNGKRRNVTRDLTEVPAQLWPEQGRASFVGLVKGELWRVRASGAKASRVLKSFDEKIDSIVWPANTNNGLQDFATPGTAYSEIVFGIRRGRELALHRLDLAADQATPITPPTAKAELLSFSQESGQSVFFANDHDGLRLWLAPRNGAAVTLFETNGFLRDIVEPEQRMIEYTSLDGEKLKGWLLLPVGYEAGRQYPLLTSVYAGSVYSEVPPASMQFGRWLSNYSAQIWAARGYAVLMPSMPLDPMGKADDPMLRLPNGVLPAVDAVVEMGVADPKRLFVMGGSFGGFSTYGLLTQTRRFAGGVAMAGLSNLISLYGQFDARMRYSDYAQEHMPHMGMMESGQTAMGSPPWQDLNRYLRNSPLFAVDRVQTPLMIVQGDMDYVALQQGEEFFNALYRQGKRARFVRYWGEGHGIRSPANARDLLERMDAWFKELAPPASSAGDGKVPALR